jgi:hypothetical protein
LGEVVEVIGGDAGYIRVEKLGLGVGVTLIILFIRVVFYWGRDYFDLTFAH